MMNLSLFEFLRENNSSMSEQVPDGNELLQFSSANHRQSRCDNRGFGFSFGRMSEFKNNLRVFKFYFMESLILAQNERWRRA